MAKVLSLRRLPAKPTTITNERQFDSMARRSTTVGSTRCNCRSSKVFCARPSRRHWWLPAWRNVGGVLRNCKGGGRWLEKATLSATRHSSHWWDQLDVNSKRHLSHPTGVLTRRQPQPSRSLHDVARYPSDDGCGELNRKPRDLLCSWHFGVSFPHTADSKTP